MPSCQGYNRKCWLSVSAEDPAQQYCSACLRASDADFLNNTLQSITFPGHQDVDESLLANLRSRPGLRAQRQIRAGAIPKCLNALFHKTNRSTFERYIRFVTSIPELQSMMFHSIHTHSRGTPCKAYLWMILHGYADMLPLPEGCAECLVNAATYMHYLPTAARDYIQLYLVSHRCTTMLGTCLRYHPDAFEILARLRANVSIHREIPNYKEQFFQNIFIMAGRTTADFQTWWSSVSHPLLLLPTQRIRPVDKAFIKARLAPYHEELVMRTWHPSRLRNWCLDLEEISELFDE